MVVWDLGYRVKMVLDCPGRVVGTAVRDVLFWVDESRGRQVLEDVLGDEFGEDSIHLNSSSPSSVGKNSDQDERNH